MEPRNRYNRWPPFEIWYCKGQLGLSAGDRRALCLFLPENVRSALLNRGDIPTVWDQEVTWEQCMEHAPAEEALSLCAYKLITREWTYQEVINVLPIFRHALSMLKMSRASELKATAALYDRFPELLKTPQAPNSYRENKPHIRDTFHIDTTRPRTRRTRRSQRPASGPEEKCVAIMKDYRFRGPNTALIPYNWCIRLFDVVTKRHTISETTIDAIYPSDLHACLQKAWAGFAHIHGHGDEPDTKRRPRIAGLLPEKPTYYLMHYGTLYGCPKPALELEWLEAFVETIAWMETKFPDECRWAKFSAYTQETELPLSTSANDIMGPDEYDRLVQIASAHDIAQQLKLDSKICDDTNGEYANSLPSLLALHLPPSSSYLSRAIATHLLPESHPADMDVRQLLYETTLTKIIKNIQGTRGKTAFLESKAAARFDNQTTRTTEVQHQEETKRRAARALRDSIRVAQDIKTSSSNEHEVNAASEALAALLKLVDLEEASTASASTEAEPSTPYQIQADYKNALHQESANRKSRPQQKAKPCYICRFIISKPHNVFMSMCVPCGDFNIAGSNFTRKATLLPTSTNKIALVTGGRVNLGFHTALRLLRQGLRVIVTTRYPQDAALRFKKAWKSDKDLWPHSNIMTVGADFRSAGDVFNVVKKVKQVVASLTTGDSDCSFYLLVNNAAQTLTDSIAKEEAAIMREDSLVYNFLPLIKPVDPDYTPRVRGGIRGQLDGSMPSATITDGKSTSHTNTDISAPIADNGLSSWVQNLSEIPYEDVISAHSVNTFAPLILIRELAPLMKDGNGKLQGHIVNVSSREGMFEDYRGSSAKRGKHVHTNMSKAGLNMITETEAEILWKEKGIAMNTVDPGYMSAAPEYEDLFDGERPIGWEDGAGRVLWPVRCMELEHEKSKSNQDKGESNMDQYWGRFFKHYGAVRVEPRFGRG